MGRVRRTKQQPGRPPEQLSLIPEVVHLNRVRPEINEHRFYHLQVWRDLFGGCALVREWGRLGQPGQLRFDRHPDPGAALNALHALARTKRGRGYSDARS